MAYPTTLSVVTGNTLVSDADHAAMHNAIETTVGTTAGTNVLKNFAAGDFPARINATNVLQQRISGTMDTAVLGTPSITAGNLATVTLGTSTFIGGTIGTALVGTSTITGGTANKINLVGYISPAVATTVAAGGTATLDLQIANEFRVTFGTGNATLVVANEVSGQKFLVSLTQDAVGTRTVTWFTTIKWAGGVAPTLTTTAAKRDTFGFIVTGTDTYDGVVVGLNH